MLWKTVLLALVATAFASSSAYLDRFETRDLDEGFRPPLHAYLKARDLLLTHKRFARDLESLGTIVTREASSELESRGLKNFMGQAKYYLDKINPVKKSSLQRTGARHGVGDTSSRFRSRPSKPQSQSDVNSPKSAEHEQGFIISKPLAKDTQSNAIHPAAQDLQSPASNPAAQKSTEHKSATPKPPQPERPSKFREN